MLLFFILGDILGGGIYALVGAVGAEVGGAIWTSFLVALLLAALTAASYAELVTKYPRAGGAALYAKQAFRNPLVAFLIAFSVVASGVTSASALARAFGGDYLAAFVSVPVAVAALAFVGIVAVVNFIGILLSVRINVALTLIELSGLVLVVAIGVAALAAGDGDPGRAVEFREGAAPMLAILGGSALAFYALIGFEDSVNIAEETARPERSYPVALFAGLAVAGAIYLVVTVVASMAVPTHRLEASSGALLEVVKVGPLAMPTKVFSAIGLMALANGGLINMIMASRLLYGMAEEGVLPRPLARLSKRETPVVAIGLTTLIAGGLILTGELATLADTTVLLLLGVFVSVNVSALLLRKDRVEHAHFVVPAFLPLLGIAACLVVMTRVEGATWLRAGALLCLGLGLWAAQQIAARARSA